MKYPIIFIVMLGLLMVTANFCSKSHDSNLTLVEHPDDGTIIEPIE